MRRGAMGHETGGAARAALAAPASRAGRLTGAIGYRRQELLVLALLAGSVLGGFAIDAYHRRTPGPLDRLEAEPPRLAALSRAPGPRARPAATPAGGGASARAGPTPSCDAEVEPPPTPARPLDLNGASAGELARLPGIGPRLAARIVARRAQLGGRFATVEDLAGVAGVGARKAEWLVALVRVAPEPIPAPAAAAAAPAEAAEPEEPSGPEAVGPP